MQRSSADYSSINSTPYLLFIGLFLYGSVVTMFPYLPPMFGFLVALNVATRSRYVIPILIYFIVYESEHNLFIFSTWLFLYFFMKFILPLLQDNLACKRCIIALSVLLSYLLLYAMLFIIYFLLGQQFLDIDFFIFSIYIVTEIIIAMVVL